LGRKFWEEDSDFKSARKSLRQENKCSWQEPRLIIALKNNPSFTRVAMFRNIDFELYVSEDEIDWRPRNVSHV
jgi:hypothetical protein